MFREITILGRRGKLRSATVIMGAMVLSLPQGPAMAHEGHAALPKKGVILDGDQLLLSEGARKAVGLTTAKITLGDVRRTIRVRARLEVPWWGHRYVTTLVAGRVQGVRVRPGQRVCAGEELARVASMELISLQREMLNAASELDLAQRLVDQKAALAEQGIVPGKELLEVQTSREQISARRQMAMRKLQALGLDQSTLQQVRASGRPQETISITSPIDGVIVHADVRSGQVVESTQHLFHVVDLSTLWAVGEVLESDIGHLRVGLPVEVELQGVSQASLPAKIDHIHLKVDPGSHTQEVIAVLAGAKEQLRPGMFGTMHIEVANSEQAIACPTDALIENRSGTFVLLRRGEGKYLRKAVHVGLRDGKRVEILDGLFPGDQVITTGSRLLASLFGSGWDVASTAIDSASDTPPGHSTLSSTTAAAERPCRSVIAQGIVELPTAAKTYAASTVPGRIARILIEHGERVEKGQILAEVDSLELRSLQLDLLETRARLRWARESLGRLEKLASKQIAAQKDVWQLETEVQRLQYRVHSLGQQLALLGLSANEITEIENLDLTNSASAVGLIRTLAIRAPAAGWIADFDIIPGQVVGIEERLFEIHDLSAIWVKAFVFQPANALLEAGQPVRVSFLADPERTVVGSIVRTAPMATGSEQVLPVWIEVDNPDQRLKEGMLARVMFAESSSSRTASVGRSGASPNRR